MNGGAKVKRISFKIVLSAFLAVLLAFSPMHHTVVNANAKTAQTNKSDIQDKVIEENAVYTSDNKPYGYLMLSKEENGASMQKLYDAIDSAVCKYVDGGGDIPTNEPYNSDGGNVFYEIPNALFKGTDYKLSINEMVSVYFTYRADHPEAFFLPPSYLFAESAQMIFLIIPGDFVLQSERIKYTNLAKQRLGEFKASINNISDEYQIAAKAHDLLMQENFYRYDSGNIPSTHHSAHSMVGWLDKSGIVCEGYAKAFQYLLSGVGIECLYVTGTSKGQAHAWNLVKNNGSWYWVDPTFNDQESLPGGFYHYYFGLPNDAFLSDHTPGTRTFGSAYQVELPKIDNDFELFYYNQTNTLISESNISSLMSVLAQNAKNEFDSGNYTVTLFAQNSTVKTKATSTINRSSNFTQMLKDHNLTLRCDSKYTVSTISSADAGTGGCIIYVNFNYHPCDVDRNTFVEKNDAQLILEALCENIPTPEFADTDQNGKISIYDAVLVLKTIA